MTRTIVDRDGAVAALTEQFTVLRELLAGLDPADWQAPSTLPGWRVHDVAAHIIGTEKMLLGSPVPEAPAEALEGEHIRGDIARLNARWLHAMADWNPAEMLEAWDAVIGARLSALEDMDRFDFDADSFTPVGPDTYGRFMRIRLFDCWLHEMDIRDGLGITAEPGAEGGARGALAFAEIEQALPMLIGKRAQAPDGARMRLELTGDLPLTVLIAVDDGRAVRVPELDREPDATLTMDSSLLVRLTGGRVAADRVRDRITVTAGDDEHRAWADRVPAALHFTI